MARDTKLRLLGGCLLLINLVLIGHYDLQGLPVLLLTFGFAASYEYLIVRRAILPLRKSTADSPGERAAPQAKNPASFPWWKWILQMGGALLLMKLIGPIPGVLAVLAYVWIKPNFGIGGAVVGSTVTGLCLSLAASMLLPQDAKPRSKTPSQQDWENVVITPPPSPVPTAPFDPGTARPIEPPTQTLIPQSSESTGHSSVQTESHYAAIYAVHPDADQIAESSSFSQWLSTSPSNQRIMQEGNADQVIAMFSAFKARQTR